MKRSFQMKAAANNRKFEKSAMLGDRIIELRKDENLVGLLTNPGK